LIAHLSRTSRAVYGNAILLLVLTTALWGLNGVVSRTAVGEISPMSMVTLRWLVVCALLWLPLRVEMRKYAAPLRAHWRFIALMALCGFTGFTVLFYLAGAWTSAVNMTLLQSSIPPMVLAGAAIFKGMRVSLRQIFGMALAIVGVGAIATRGELANLGTLAFNVGDLMMLAACVLYAAYTVALRGRPPLPALVFFSGMALAAFALSLPFLATEMVTGHTFWPTPKGWWLMIFVALGPSLASQVFFMRAVELIGPSRAGVFSNLTPLFGALFAISLLGEPFHFYHAEALALGLGGIALAESGARS